LLRCFTPRDVAPSMALRPGMPIAEVVCSVMLFATIVILQSLRRYVWCSRRQAFLCSPLHPSHAEILRIYFVFESLIFFFSAAWLAM
jgi:hypothetical protein